MKINKSVLETECFLDGDKDLLRYIKNFAKNSVFSQPKDFYCNTPYFRPLRPQDITHRLLVGELSKSDLHHSDHLLAQRLLLNIYEQDLMFLPHNEKNFHFEEFKNFYDPAFCAEGKFLRPALEKFAFSWLDKEVHVNGVWSIDAFVEYTNSILNEIDSSESMLYKNLTESSDPQHAAKFFMIQCAGDFLSEASAMGRNVLGNYGVYTSELFKILIDEYGYGVNSKKHSTFFEEMLTEAGLSCDIHHYWQFYTPCSLALINYFHYVSANHGSFFKYIGAMYFTEASLALVTKMQSRAISEIFHGEVSTIYFDEHNHIDKHHGRMALEKIIKPIVKQYGIGIVPDILRGFEEFRLLQEEADQELFNHFRWHDSINQHKEKASKASALNSSFEFSEKKGELSVTHTHPVDELFSVHEGEIELIFSPFKKIKLSREEGIVIPKGLLHGSRVLSENCRYSVAEYMGEQ